MQDELFTEIRVTCYEPLSVAGRQRKIVMIPFGGEATGEHFRGRVTGTGVDTQTIGPDGKATLSARYMLEGKDAAGNACRVFVENQGNGQDGFRPTIVTDSPLLQDWETAELYATVDPTADGVTVRIFRKRND